MPSVLVADRVDPSCTDLLASRGIDVEYLPDIPSEQLADAAKPHQGLIVRSKRVGANAMHDDLHVVGRAGVGVDAIDVHAAADRDVAVLYAPYSNIHSVAEYVCGAVLDTYRQFSRLDQGMKWGEWEKSSDGARELRGRRVGILGFGNVGAEVARRLAPFGVDIVYHDPYTTKQVPYEHRSLDDLFSGCDIVTVHTRGADGLVTRQLIERMPEGGLFINTARASAVAPGALEAALRSRPDLQAIIDVHEQEGQGPDVHSLRPFENRVLLTPHVAGSTQEAQQQAASDIGSQVADYLTMGIAADFANGNPLPFPHDAYGHMKTAWSLAYLASLWNGTNPRTIEVMPGRDLAPYADALRRAAEIGRRRAAGAPATWLNCATSAELSARDSEHLVLTANPDHPKKRIALGGSYEGDAYRGTPVLSSLEEYSGAAANQYSVSQPLRGALAFFLYHDGKGALEALGRAAKEHNLNIVGASQRASRSRRYALCIFELEGNNHRHLSDLRWLDTTPASGPQRLRVYHALSAHF